MIFLSLLNAIIFSGVAGSSDSTTDSNFDPVVIYSVSTVLGKQNTYPQGSIMGGTILYMKVSGLDQTASNNAVYIGKYPCLISDKGVNGLFMNCRTTKPDNGDTNLSYLKIVIRVANKQDSVCTFNPAYCHFTYDSYLTPKLFYVTPRSNYPRTLSYWRARWQVSSNLVQYLEGQYMGANRCDRFTIQDDYLDNINQSDDIVVCQVSAEIEAGSYPYTIRSLNGYQSNDAGIRQKNVYSDVSYDSKIIPIITSLSTSFASPSGQLLIINGFGFSSSATNNIVKVTGQTGQITVISSSPTQIIAKIPELPNLPKLNQIPDGSIYMQGSGLHYTRYNLTGLTGVNGDCYAFRDTIQKNPSKLEGRALFDGIYSEPDVQNTFGTGYGQYFRGFFKAPIQGNYKFYLAADDCASLYLSSEPNKNVPPATPIANSNQCPYHIYWYEYLLNPKKTPKQISDPISLEQDQYYYIELYHTNALYTGTMTLSVEIENSSGNRKSNSVNSLYTIKTSYQAIKEIIEYKIYNSDGNTLPTGTYALQFTYGTYSSPQVGVYYYYTTTTFSLSTQASTIARYLQNASGGNYLLTMVATKLDNMGIELPSSSTSFAGYKYTMTFDSYRGTEQYRALPKIVSSTLAGGTIVQEINSIQDPCDPISGTFQLSLTINGVEKYFQVSDNHYDLPFDSTTILIANNIERITGQKPYVWTEGRWLDGQTWRIKFRSYVEGLTSFSSPSNILTSGNGPVDITIEETIPKSDNLFFEPIPNELLFTYSNKPQIQVSTNDILAGCEQLSACDFTNSDTRTATLTSYSLNGAILTINLVSGVDLPTILPIDLTINFAGAQCTNIKFTNAVSPYTLTCTLESLNGKAISEAGSDQIPLVHHKIAGFAIIDSGVTKQNTELVITSITPTSGTPEGGSELTIIGSGFPKSMDKEFQITMGGVNVIPLSINNQQITLMTPAGTVGTIEISFNGKVKTDTTFIYDPNLRVYIESLDFNEESPVYRGLLKINGRNFGTVAGDLKVSLVGDKKTYNAKVIETQDTQITVYLRGGMPGNYRIFATRKYFGKSQSEGDTNLFKYIIKVTSVTLEDGVTPASGSEAGGTMIKIKGSNFLKGETIVFIGTAVNWICEIDETRFTSDTIYCMTPAKFEYYEILTHDVTVTVKVSLESTCVAENKDNCKFTYDPNINPIIDAYPVDAEVYTGSRLLTELDQTKPDYHKIIQRKQYFWTEETKQPGLNHMSNHGKSARRDMLSSSDLVVTQLKTYKPGDQETLTGTKLTTSVKVIFKGPITTSVIATLTDNQFTYIIPEMPQGLYNTFVLTTAGYADKIWITKVDLHITSIPDGTIGGQILQISGFGFNSDKQPSVTVDTLPCSELSVVSSVLINCRMPRVAGSSLKITLFQLPSDTTSSIPINSTYTLTILPVASTAIIQSVKLNDADKFDSVKKANLGTAGSVVLKFTGVRLTGTDIKVTLEHKNHKINGITSDGTDASVTATFSDLAAGLYQININIDGKYAWWTSVSAQSLIISTSLPSSNVPTISYNGGSKLTLTGQGFDIDKKQNQVSLCGFDCPIISSTFTTLECEAPKLITVSNIGQYPALDEPPRYIRPSEVTLTGDNQILIANFFDLQQSTYYDSSATSNCYAQINFGENKVLKLHQLRFIPKIDQLALYLQGAILQYSLDGNTWVDLLTVDQTVHTGWNIFLPKSDISGIKAIRLFDSRGTAGSHCALAEIELKGWVYSSTTNSYSTPTTCNAEISVNGLPIGQVSNAASYSSNATPIINEVSPLSGSFTDQVEITILGTGFIDQQTTVTIDGVVCVIKEVSATKIICKTGVKDLEQTQLDGVFEVRVNGNLAVVNNKFIYASKWSDLATWGGYEYPGDGDSVIVNKGQTLIVDVKTPKLIQVLVEGTLTFSDDLDTSMDAHYIVIREGKFNIGSETKPHQHKVQITLYGEEKDVQMPSMGNKVLGCHQCELNIHGIVRTPTWTLLSSTVDVGNNQITVDDPVDWQIGEQIFIASSDYDHNQSEKKKIVAVSEDKKTLTLDEPFYFKHYSETETYGNDKFPMKVEVGLLTRNIVLQGEQSVLKHGYHLMIHGRAEKGAIGKISYAEFRYGGQPRIIGRYPVHYHLNGEMDESYTIGNSIHDCYARCLTIHGVHFLKVQKNVCYNTFGHAIFLEDGVETNNIIEDNLVAGTRQSWVMLQTDITVSTYWITNPQNILRRNRSGGSEWYGFWYEIKANPDGPSATSDICPTGLNVLEFNDNWSHSNGKFGLRIFELSPRQYPCISWINGTAEPFKDNPSIQAVFSNFFTWKNNKCGVLGESIGNVLFKDFMISDSKLAGFQSHKTNTSLEGAILDNALIIGRSTGNPYPQEYYAGSRALIVPKTNGFLAKNIKLYNFGSNTALIESCSVCWNIKDWISGGRNSHFKNFTMYNSETARRIHWNNYWREIFWDLDGSFSNIEGGAYIIPYKNHINGIDGCITHHEQFWHNSIICAMNKITIRDVLINNPAPEQDFLGVEMKLFRLDETNVALKMNRDIDEATLIQPETMYGLVTDDVYKSFVSVFATGFIYNVHFKFGASDPLSMGVFASPYFTPEDKAVILRFNYSANRESFDIYRNINKTFPHKYSEIQAIPDVNACNQGDWYNDRKNKLFFLCLSGKNKKQFEYMEVRAVICKTECANLGDNVPLESEFRYWSHADTWVENKVPVEGDSPTIEAGYQVILDVDTPKLVNLTILGSLIFDERRTETILQAERIWVKSGKLIAGSVEKPFPGKIKIIIHGEFGDNPLVIDAKLDIGNKVLAITRGLELYSPIPGTVWTRLALFADAGTNVITVLECQGWKVGDEIVFGPSGSDPEQREKKTITAINSCDITLDTPLEFDHYGSPTVTIDKSGIGKLDLRAIVGHLTRNIKIEGGPSKDGLGCRVLIYQYEEQGSSGIPRRGYALLHGVEFNNCGQYDTDRSGLDFRNLQSSLITTQSEVTGCSFHDSTGMLLTVQSSRYITITNNVFFTGIKALVQIYNSKYVKFQNNALIYVKKRIVAEQPKWVKKINNWAVFGNFINGDNDMVREKIDISNNAAQGSQDTGFFVTTTHCPDAYRSSFYDNQCSGAVLACFSIVQAVGDCNYIQGLMAAHSSVGIMYAIFTEELQLDKSISAENSRGIALMTAPHNLTDNIMKMSNSYITAQARHDCPKCYTESLNPYCNYTFGIQLGVTSKVVFPPIDTTPSTESDTICKPQKADLKVYISNVEFNSFKLQYDGTPLCANNAAFRQHAGAHDMTGQHFLRDSSCTNCDFGALLYNLTDRDPNKLGWMGGCGSFLCTGQINWFIEDQTGHFFGQIGQGIPNNSYFGPNVTYCSKQNEWNGYWCPGTKITTLQFMSVAPDYNKRLYSPIKLTDGLFFNEINSQFEWFWNGAEPLNLRESKFVGLITANSVIDMSNAGQNPSQSEYWLSKRSEEGSGEDYVILKWTFTEPYIIQVSVGDKVIQPGITTKNKHSDLMTLIDQCGANNYFFENRTIHFVVNGKLGCRVKISLKNTLQVTTRLAVTTEEFFGEKFLQYAVAQLGGDPFNYFIIGTKKSPRRFLTEASTYNITVDWGIIDSDIGTEEAAQSESKLSDLSNKLESFHIPPEMGVVLDHSSKLIIKTNLDYPSSESTQQDPVNSPNSESGTTNNNQNSNSNPNDNPNSNSNSIEQNQISITEDDEAINPSFTEDDSISTANTGTIQKSLSKQSSGTSTVTIIVAVISSVVGVSIIIIGLLYYKKVRLTKIMEARVHQRIDNENEQVKQNITLQNMLE